MRTLSLLFICVLTLHKHDDVDACIPRRLRFVRHVIREVFQGFDNNLFKRQTNENEEVEIEVKKVVKKIKIPRLLPDSEYEETESFLPFYNDVVGCFDQDKSKEYRGRISFTESGQKCANWAKFTSSIRKDMNEAVLRHSASNYSLFRLKRTNEELNMFAHDRLKTEIINGTIRYITEQGLIFHNYCRDPDGVGRLWCFIEETDDLLWEYCSVPICTLCWKIRQKSFERLAQIGLVSSGAWFPSCSITGEFENSQCWDRYCWCSTSAGSVVKGSLRDRKRKIYDCRKYIRYVRNKTSSEEIRNKPNRSAKKFK